MRDIALLLCLLLGLGATCKYPFAGVLLWVLLALMSPHEETYSFARSLPWNLIVAVLTIGVWLISSERKAPPKGIATFLVFALLAWMTFNTFFAFDPSWSWGYWNRVWKIFALGVLAGTLAVNKVRFHAVIWVVALSLCYYGVKGGLFTLVTGGGFHVLGPPDTILGDNNVLAAALVMTLPMLNYLRLHSGSRLVRIALTGSIVLCATSVLGSYSRGGYIALGAMALIFWFRAKSKLLYPVIAAVVLIPLIEFMPASFFNRAASIQDYNTDASFQSRLDSWWLAYRYAMDHFPFGAGFYGMNLQAVWDRYIPGELHAIHSIYFQILGEQGVVGLILYVAVIAVGFYNFSAVMRDTKGVSGFAWAYDLASAMQLSLLAYCIGGSAVPMAYYDVFPLWVFLGAALHEHTKRQPAAFRTSVLPPVLEPLGVPPT